MELTPLLSSRRTWFGVGVLYAALTLRYAWPLLPALGSRLPGDTGDARLNSWILWWNAQALPLTERWWNAPAFFPAHGAFAFSETLLGIAPLTSCVQWFGASAVQAHNIAYLFSFFAAALSAHALARRLTGSHAAALVAGVGFGFNPVPRGASVPHPVADVFLDAARTARSSPVSRTSPASRPGAFRGVLAAERIDERIFPLFLRGVRHPLGSSGSSGRGGMLSRLSARRRWHYLSSRLWLAGYRPAPGRFRFRSRSRA